MKLNFKWVTKTHQYQTGEYLYINRVCLGEYSWNSGKSRDNPDKSIDYIGSVDLPCISKSNKLYGANPEEVKPKIERLVTKWFEEIFKDDAQEEKK